MKSTGETKASTGGVRLARDNRPGVRRTIAVKAEEDLFRLRLPRTFRAFPHAFLKRTPMNRVAKAPPLALQFRLNQHNPVSGVSFVPTHSLATRAYSCICDKLYLTSECPLLAALRYQSMAAGLLRLTPSPKL